MISNIETLKAHADAVDALVEESNERIDAMMSAQSALVEYDKTPLRDMALQGLARALVRMQESRSALTPYARTLRLYVNEQSH